VHRRRNGPNFPLGWDGKKDLSDFWVYKIEDQKWHLISTDTRKYVREKEGDRREGEREGGRGERERQRKIPISHTTVCPLSWREMLRLEAVNAPVLWYVNTSEAVCEGSEKKNEMKRE
jgi:hypothetical protein